MDFIGLAKAILGVAQPLLEKALFERIMKYLDEYELNEKELQAERLRYPNWDDAKLSVLMKNRARLKEAIAQQALLVKASGSK